MRNKLIYDNRFFRTLFHWIGRAILRFGGWTIAGNFPTEKKYVAIAAPHTSNWDFPFFMGVVGAKNMRPLYLGKDTLFKGPLGWLFYYLGGIPVDRSSPNAADIVDQVVAVFNEREHLVLGIAPEGTRSGVAKWKTGFYRIAQAANVPILLAFIDSSRKEIGFGPMFQPTGDMEKDMKAIQAFYADKVGVNPQNQQVLVE